MKNKAQRGDSMRSRDNCGAHVTAAGERGAIFESKDGTSWTREPLVADSNFTGILGTKDATLVVGSEGTIVRKIQKAPQ